MSDDADRMIQERGRLLGGVISSPGEAWRVKVLDPEPAVRLGCPVCGETMAAASPSGNQWRCPCSGGVTVILGTG